MYRETLEIDWQLQSAFHSRISMMHTAFTNWAVWDTAPAQGCAGVQVTLIDQSDRFVFKPLLYELINGGARPEEVAPPFQELLAPYQTQFIQVTPPPPFLAPQGSRAASMASVFLEECYIDL